MTGQSVTLCVEEMQTLLSHSAIGSAPTVTAGMGLSLALPQPYKEEKVSGTVPLGTGRWWEPNQALEPTPYSVRSCLAPAFGRGSPLVLGRKFNL